MREKRTDAVVIGGGSAGLAAASRIAGAGYSVVVLERENELGGILNQCIHNGFGLQRFKEDLSGPEYAELVGRHVVRDAVRDVVRTANENGASYERVVSFLLAPEGFTVENGLLTPTLKLRRRAIADRFKEEIESLYRSLEGRHAHQG
mgnify:CR=1 FL=1